MPNLDGTQVQGEEVLDATTPASQTPSESVASATPSASPVDAEALAKLQAQIAKYEQDVRNLKSMSDKRLNEVERQYQQKESELRQQLEDMKVAQMDDTSREKYLKELDKKRAMELEQKASQSSRIQEDYQASLQAIQHFTSLGVPLTELVLNEGYDKLFQSGYAYVTGQYQKLASGQTKVPEPPKAPEVVTKNGSNPPNIKPKWSDLEKVYGSREAVYRGVETGRLSPDIIPTDE